MSETPPTSPQSSGQAQTIGWTAFAATALPGLFLLILSTQLRLPVTLWRQNLYLGLAILVGVIACAGIVVSRWSGRTSPTLPALVAGGSLLVVLAVLWNKVFWSQVPELRHLLIFRFAMRTLHAPFYGHLALPTVLWASVFCGVGVLALGVLARRLEEILKSRTLLPRLVLLQIALTLFVALNESPTRAFGFMSGYYTFGSDLRHFDGILDVLYNYVDKMPALSYYAHHYPPGILAGFELAESLGLLRLAKIVGLSVPALTLLPLRGLARELGLDWPAVNAAMILYATSAGILVFPTLTPTPALIFLTTTALWMLMRGLETGRLWTAVAMGLCIGFYFLFSFVAYMVAAPMGVFTLFAVVDKRVAPQRAIAMVAVALAAFAVFFVLVYLTTGFDIIACFDSATRLHVKQLGSSFAEPKDYLLRTVAEPTDYLLRSTGGLIAYLLSAGAPLSVLACLALRGVASDPNPPRLLRPFVWGSALGIVLSAFNGMSFLETERIWLFYTPMLAVLAGWELDRRRRREGRLVFIGVIVVAMAFSCTYALCYRHHLDRRSKPLVTEPQMLERVLARTSHQVATVGSSPFRRPTRRIEPCPPEFPPTANATSASGVCARSSREASRRARRSAPRCVSHSTVSPSSTSGAATVTPSAAGTGSATHS